MPSQVVLKVGPLVRSNFNPVNNTSPFSNRPQCFPRKGFPADVCLTPQSCELEHDETSCQGGSGPMLVSRSAHQPRNW